MTPAGGTQEFTIKAKPVMSDEGRFTGPRCEFTQDFLGAVSLLDVAISNASITLDEGRNRSPRSCETCERLLRTEAARSESHRGNLDKLVVLRVQPGRFQVINDKCLASVLAISPVERMPALGTRDPGAHCRLRAR